jgi:NlpC/P60 family putative phage cell wall peptidase
MELLKEAEQLGLRWGRSDGQEVARQAVVAEARSWIGTPYQHQGEMKGVGVDCGGLIRGVSVALGLIPANYKAFLPVSLMGYARRPDGYLGRDLCDLYWNRIELDALVPGDLVLFSYGNSGVPHHIGVIGDYPGGLSVIHALGPRTTKKVVEHRFDAKWRGRAIAAYSLPGVV